MASLELDPQSRRYRVRFRFRGREHKRSLQTRCQRSAMAAKLRLEETIELVQGGRLPIPDGVDVVRFLMSDGRLTAAEPAGHLLTLGELLARYRDAIPEGAKEATTLYTEGIHLRHARRLLPMGRHANELDVSLLQGYVRRRLTESRHGRPISADTIRKEIATLRVAWNWGIDQGLVAKSFPSRGLLFPKRNEKPPFRTWDEITRTLSRGGLSQTEETELWESLFLTRGEIEEFLAVVEQRADRDFVHPMVLMAAHRRAA